MSQNYSNHKRYVPGFHVVLGSLIVVVLVASIVNLVCCMGSCHAGSCGPGGCCIWQGGIVPLIVAVILLLLFWYSRQFAVTVQNRAIRAEENMRHFVMTGKPQDSRLTMGQIVALRFAGDDEYLSLSDRAINEQMKPEEIKKAIKNWRSDDYRC